MHACSCSRLSLQVRVGSSHCSVDALHLCLFPKVRGLRSDYGSALPRLLGAAPVRLDECRSRVTEDIEPGTMPCQRCSYECTPVRDTGTTTEALLNLDHARNSRFPPRDVPFSGDPALPCRCQLSRDVFSGHVLPPHPLNAARSPCHHHPAPALPHRRKKWPKRVMHACHLASSANMPRGAKCLPVMLYYPRSCLPPPLESDGDSPHPDSHTAAMAPICPLNS